MFASKTHDTRHLGREASAAADQAMRSSRRAAHDALDSMTDTVHELRARARPAFERVSDEASALAHRSADAMRDASEHLRERALRATDTTVTYVRSEPIKATLIAAVVGAALMALLTMSSRSRHR